ncbi:uroporphyrinogen-III C-methyltransferase [Hydrogenophaga sp.]|uniref:uroporphyrinogen-III C-methyltransferase n=1 Tax=Hydrogenophaga sp. TaxID=1904254 RepID=UPI00286D839C|nr:uroporphyrinogen-III C-methyltransferase [Hydrogenophaga sp.]
MSENTPLPTSEAAPPPAPAPVAPPAAVRIALAWPVWLALGAALIALLLVGLLWQKLSFTQQELARRSQDSAAQAVEARTLAAQAEAQTQELQARLAVAEVKLSEVTLQRSQLEELMLTLSRSRDDTLVQDIESALRLAQQQAQLTGSAQPLLSALQAADQRIARAAQPRLNPVQRALARDIQRIQGAVLTDVPALVQRLDELVRQVEQWPLLNDVGPRAAPATTKPHAAKATTRAGTATAAPPAAAAPAPADRDSAWPSWWGRLWGNVSRSGRELVRVSRIDHPDAALLAPEQAFFLRENLKLQLLNARLGLLARQTASAQADVRAVEALLTRYFDGTAPTVRGAQAALTQLRAELVPVELPRPDESLAALAAAAGGR